jgi:hypothetical protein
MDTKVVVYCPKCDGEDVEVVCTDQPRVERVSMDALPHHAPASYCVTSHRSYRATCRVCGYARDYLVSTASYLSAPTMGLIG